MLIEQALETGYEEYGPLATLRSGDGHPQYQPMKLGPTHDRLRTRQDGMEYPAQHRTGNGHVYCSDYISDDGTAGTAGSSQGRTSGWNRQHSFKTGRRKKNE